MNGHAQNPTQPVLTSEFVPDDFIWCDWDNNATMLKGGMDKQEFDVTREQWIDNDGDNFFRAHASKVEKAEDPAHTCATQFRIAVKTQVLNFTVRFAYDSAVDDWQSIIFNKTSATMEPGKVNVDFMQKMVTAFLELNNQSSLSFEVGLYNLLKFKVFKNLPVNEAKLAKSPPVEFKGQEYYKVGTLLDVCYILKILREMKIETEKVKNKMNELTEAAKAVRSYVACRESMLKEYVSYDTIMKSVEKIHIETKEIFGDSSFADGAASVTPPDKKYAELQMEKEALEKNLENKSKMLNELKLKNKELTSSYNLNAETLKQNETVIKSLERVKEKAEKDAEKAQQQLEKLRGDNDELLEDIDDLRKKLQAAKEVQKGEEEEDSGKESDDDGEEVEEDSGKESDDDGEEVEENESSDDEDEESSSEDSSSEDEKEEKTPRKKKQTGAGKGPFGGKQPRFAPNVPDTTLEKISVKKKRGRAKKRGRPRGKGGARPSKKRARPQATINLVAQSPQKKTRYGRVSKGVNKNFGTYDPQLKKYVNSGQDRVSV